MPFVGLGRTVGKKIKTKGEKQWLKKEAVEEEAVCQNLLEDQ